MMASRHPCPLLQPTADDLAALLDAGVSKSALWKPGPICVSCGHKAADGLFEPDSYGERWFAVELPEVDDVVFWQSESEAIASWSGRAFALGEEIITQAATYSFDHALNVFATPMDWLKANRDGIVVLPERWSLLFDRLRDAPRVAIAETLLPRYRHHMKPRVPKLLVIPTGADPS